MTTLFTTSPDGQRIAYERIGTGPALLLLHGGGSSRQEWHAAGYVKRLQDDFTVIPIDLRGHGESAAPTDSADYTIDKMMGDILAVADACGVERFTLWGFSFGGRVGRHIAARSSRVARLVLMGSPLGHYITPEFRQYMDDFLAHWSPILQSQRDGRLDLSSLSPDDREFLEDHNVPAMLAWSPAMFAWSPVEPADFLCPVLWLVGSEDRVMTNVRELEPALGASTVQLHILEGLDHSQVFEEIDRVLPLMLTFTRS